MDGTETHKSRGCLENIFVTSLLNMCYVHIYFYTQSRYPLQSIESAST
jgi:hypothetical protein